MTSSSLFPSRESGTAVKRSLLLLPGLALAFAGCAIDTSVPAGKPTPDRVLESTTVAPAVEPISDGDLVGHVVSTVASDEGITIGPSMAGEYAVIVCQGFEDGLSPLVMVRIGVQEMPRFSEEEHAFLVGASVGALCPEFSFVFGGL